jgi:subtilisin family serine protease
MKKVLLSLIFLLTASALVAQSNTGAERYFVYFKDKDVSRSPIADFHPKALQRRFKSGVAFPMLEDYPVNAAYVTAVAQLVERPRFALRWFNALSVEATSAQIMQVLQLPFVLSVEPFEELEVQLAGEWNAEESAKGPSDSLQFHTLFNHQRDAVAMHVAEERGLSGKGIRVAVFDAGFSGVDTHPAFDHLRKNGQIKLTKDFVGGGEDVYGHSGHGTAVLSCIGGLYEGKRIGAAVDAEFILARTERNLREVKSEEDNWLAAMEWADQQGADIISSSLGYGKPRHTYADMDGEKTLVSRAAAMGVRKGMLVVNSAGNEGAGKFHYISAPGDADSVLTVGASYPMLYFRMPFSSFGPNYNHVLKPEISAPGYVLAANKKGEYKPIGGTSFACPLMSGLAACLMQQFPEATNMDIKQKAMMAGHTYPYFDYALGYGVFSIERALWETTTAAPTFETLIKGDTTWFLLDPVVVNRDTATNKNGKPFSYRFVKQDGTLSSYKTFLVRKGNSRFGITSQQRTEGKLETWFEGYYWKEER